MEPDPSADEPPPAASVLQAAADNGRAHRSAVVYSCDERSQCAAGNGQLDTDRWAGLAAAVLRDEGVSSGELGLRFVDPGVMAELNRAHMGVVGPTDVLAFPIDGADNGAASPGQVPLLGDVVVCPGYAAAQAPDHAGTGHDGSLTDELALLVVHGVLHVLGYDHVEAADAVVMQAREQQLLTAHHRRS